VGPGLREPEAADQLAARVGMGMRTLEPKAQKAEMAHPGFLAC
jgi:hypothetical protein